MNQNNRKTGGNLSTTFAIRCLAAAYLLYSLFDIIRAYFGVGEDKPSLLLLLLSIVVLGGGGLFVACTAYREWKRSPGTQSADTSGAVTAEADAAIPGQTEETEIQP